MDYEKIGKLILEKRKEAGLTQKELADKLNITDRAISRWERGKGCPDISMLEPLAKELKVSVLEILHGEKIDNDENKVVIDILKKSNRKTMIWKTLSLIFINLLMVLLIGVYVLYFLVPKVLFSNDDLKMYMVRSTSMEPTYKVYDMLLFKKCNIEDVKIGDVILFNSQEHPDYPIAHRVSEILNQDGSPKVYTDYKDNGYIKIVSKADYNEVIDRNYVTKENFFGKVHKVYPGLGKYYSDYTIFDEEKEIAGIHTIGIFLLLAIVSIIWLDAIQVIRLKNKTRRVS